MQDNCARLAGSWCGLILRFGAIALFLFAFVAPSYAGSFIFAGEANGVDVITHPTGYTGTGGNLTVTVGIDPNSPNANELETPVRNLINVLNGLNPTDGNLVFGAANNIPSNNIDFESVALHEVGHCIGLGYVNLASESGLSIHNGITRNQPTAPIALSMLILEQMALSARVETLTSSPAGMLLCP